MVQSGTKDRRDDDTSTPLLNNNELKPKVPKTPTSARKAAVMIAALFTQMVVNGMIFSLPVHYAELITIFQSNRSNAALVQSLFSGICTGGGILWSPFIKRFGPGPCTAVGAVVGAAMFAVNFVASDLSMIITTVGVGAGLFLCSCYLTPFISVSWTFRDPGLALVILTVGSALGQFIIPYLNEVFIKEYGLEGAYLLSGGVALQILPFACIMYTSREFYYKGDNYDTKKSTGSKCSLDMTLFKDVVISIVLLNCFLLSLTGNVEAWFMVDIIASRGYERERGSLIVSLIGLAMFVGRINGMLIRFKCSIPSVFHWMYLCPLVGICHAVVLNLSNYWMILGLCVICGILFGTTTSQTPAIMFEASGLERYPQGMALVNLMYGLGNFFSGILGGTIRDTYGDYIPMFYLALAASLYIALSTGVVACVMKLRQRKEMSDTSVKYEKLQKSSITIVVGND